MALDHAPPSSARTAATAPWLVGVVSAPAAIARFAETPARERVIDLLEVRVDLFEALEHVGSSAPSISISTSMSSWADSARAVQATGTPVLLTVRLAAEGGRWKRSEADRLTLYQSAVAEKACTWVDVEASSAIARDVTDLARAGGATSIVSHHDFARTPSLAELERVVARCRAAGADVPKIATKVNGDADRDALFALAAAHAGEACVIGMGAPELRIDLPSRGSRLAYAYVDAPTAPGQLSAGDMDARLRAASPAYAARRASAA